MLNPETVTALWSKAIKEAFVQERSEPHVFAELIVEWWMRRGMSDSALENVEMAERAWESYNKLKAEGKIPADLDCGTTTRDPGRLLKR